MSIGARPIGYFVHHQGRGHAERCAALVNALPRTRPVTIFSARDDIFPPLRAGVRIRRIGSLFEPRGDETCHDPGHLPDTLHCAPVGWPGIRDAMGTMAAWFRSADPALMISDVSAEVAQLARLCSVPHVKVLQHGRRDDPGHRAAYASAAGLLAPCDPRLAQDDWTEAMRSKTCFAAGLGVNLRLRDRGAARAELGLDRRAHVVLVMSGGGGSGIGNAPIAVGARALPESNWITVGSIARDWHATEPPNLRHDGWVADTGLYLSAADLVVAPAGNTGCHEILAAGRPWLAVPEWRYFDEQVAKAQALERCGVVHVARMWPSSVQSWREVLRRTVLTHDPQAQRVLLRPDAARHAAGWIEDLIARIWPERARRGGAALHVAAQ